MGSAQLVGQDVIGEGPFPSSDRLYCRAFAYYRVQKVFLKILFFSKKKVLDVLRAPLAGLWLLQKRLWLWLTRWSHFFRWAKVILKNHLVKRLIGCFSERPCTGRSLLYVARDWGQDQKNNLDWWEGYCAKMTWAEAGWGTFFGSCPLVHFGKALHSWSHLNKRCLTQLLHKPEPKLKNKPYQRGPKKDP
jgi:hypothetical protein